MIEAMLQLILKHQWGIPVTLELNFIFLMLKEGSYLIFHRGAYIVSLKSRVFLHFKSQAYTLLFLTQLMFLLLLNLLTGVVYLMQMHTALLLAKIATSQVLLTMVVIVTAILRAKLLPRLLQGIVVLI